MKCGTAGHGKINDNVVETKENTSNLPSARTLISSGVGNPS